MTLANEMMYVDIMIDTSRASLQCQESKAAADFIWDFWYLFLSLIAADGFWSPTEWHPIIIQIESWTSIVIFFLLYLIRAQNAHNTRNLIFMLFATDEPPKPE